MEVYWSEIEYRYRKTAPDHQMLKGGFVYAFVKAADARDALSKFTSAIECEGLSVEKVAYVSPYGETAWPTQQDEQKFTQLVRDADAGTKVVFDEFYAFRET